MPKKPSSFLDLASGDADEKTVARLKEKGYCVIEPPEEASTISNLDGLVRFFYATMAKYNPVRKTPYSASSTDRKVLADLVKSREKAGLSRKAAYAECSLIVETLFKYEKDLNFEGRITSARILTSSWIVSRLLAIINNEDELIRTKLFEKGSVLLDKSTDTEEFHDEARRDLDKMYKKVVIDGVKKDSRKKRIANLKGRRGRD